MEKRKQQIVVFWPVGQWSAFVGISALLLWFGMTNPLHATFSRWNWTVVFAFFAVGFVWTPVPVVGRESLWMVRLFGLYWKRVRGRNLVSVVMKPHSLFLRSNDGEIELVESFSMRRNRRIAETLHERFGVEVKPYRP